MELKRDFVHLHNHSTYSFGDGISQIKDMVAKAKEMGMHSLALTDHGYGHGLLEFHRECTKQGIKPILGCEIYLCLDGVQMDCRSEENRGANHLILLAKNRTGYYNLIKILSRAATDGYYYKPKADYELLSQFSEGLICLSACLAGPVACHLYNNPNGKAQVNVDKAILIVDRLKQVFGDDLFLEIQFHGMKADKGQGKDLQSQLIENMLPVSRKTGVPLIATNDAHYVEPKNWPHRNIIIADGSSTTIYDPTAYLDREGQYYLKSIDQMWEVFGHHDPSVITNTVEVARRVEEYDPGLELGHRLPSFTGDTDELFKKLVLEGFKKRYPKATKHSPEWQRLTHEVKIIETLGFKDYFLIVQDFIYDAERRGIPVGPGRGSAAGSIIAYCMGITTLCPIENNLLFERFLNPERVSLPDIDVDVCKERRGEVIKYVEDKYGRDHVAQIITFNRIKGKGALRAVGRALDVPIHIQDELSNALPRDAGEFSVSLKQIVEGDSEAPSSAVQIIQRFMSQDEDKKEYIESAVALEGTYTHSGVHAAAVVIAPDSLEDILPIRRSKDTVTTQFSMNDVEDLGLLKMDFLGLDTLSMVTNALTMIMEDDPDGPLKGTRDVTTLRRLQERCPDLNDPRVYDAVFKSGRTMGVFQCDSDGLRTLLARIGCSSFNDVSAAIALYRPGPLDSGMVESFIKRRRGVEKETSWHEDLKPYVSKTHGLPIYQEQIMFASQVLCGFSMAKADKLRKVIGKKKKDDIAAFRKEFVDAAVKTGKVSAERADEIYTEIEFFGRYAFNLAHSAAYAVIAYYTAWLKTYYPAYFLAALLNKFTAGQGEEDTKKKKNDDETFLKYLLEAQAMGIKISPPDINTSHMAFRPTGDRSISYGLGSLKGVGPSTQDLINYREEHGNFKTFSEFLVACIKLGINKRVVMGFVTAGVISFGTTKEALKRLVDGFQRPKANGDGLTKAKKSVLDDVRDLIKKLETRPKKYEKMTEEAKAEFDAGLQELYEDGLKSIDSSLPGAVSRSYKVMDPPGLYKIKKEVRLCST